MSEPVFPWDFEDDTQEWLEDEDVPDEEQENVRTYVHLCSLGILKMSEPMFHPIRNPAISHSRVTWWLYHQHDAKPGTYVMDDFGSLIQVDPYRVAPLFYREKI
jgi:hypothetical protein